MTLPVLCKILLFVALLWAPCFEAAETSEPLLFENIGEMYAGMSYINTLVPVDMDALRNHVLAYHKALSLEFSRANLVATYDKVLLNISQAHGVVYESNFNGASIDSWESIGKSHILQMEQYLARVDNLFEVMPAASQESLRFAASDFTKGEDEGLHPSEPHRSKRFAPIVVAAAIGLSGLLGLSGTAFGIHNTWAIDQLKDQMSLLSQQHEVLRVNVERLDADSISMRTSINQILASQAIASELDSTEMLSKLSIKSAEILDYIIKCENTVQQAQHRRLAINYLSKDQVANIFYKTQQQAQALHAKLLINDPSELFQIETTAYFNGRVFFVVLHVPMAPIDGSMRLYRLHPFPLPLADKTFIIPNVKDDILAISNTPERFTAQLSSVDLVGCLKINKIHLCPRNGVLQSDPKDSCLGVLYHQHYDLAKTLCSFTVEPAREFVRQLRNNWFLVYSMTAQTIPLSCRNDTHFEMHIKKGASKVHMPNGCIARSPKHKLLSDMSITLPTDFVQVDMSWNPETLLPGHKDSIIPEFEKLLLHGHSSMPLSALQAMALHSNNNSYVWMYLFIAFAVISFLTIIVLIGTWVLFKVKSELSGVQVFIAMQQKTPPAWALQQPPAYPVFPSTTIAMPAQLAAAPAIAYAYPQTPQLRRTASIHTIAPMQDDYVPMEHVSSKGGKSDE